MGLTRAIRYCESLRLDAPAVAGWIRPVVLLPVSALSGLTTAQLEAVIAHELAHIRRYDTLVNLFQVGVETLLFYHPAVWWLGGASASRARTSLRRRGGGVVRKPGDVCARADTDGGKQIRAATGDGGKPQPAGGTHRAAAGSEQQSREFAGREFIGGCSVFIGSAPGRKRAGGKRAPSTGADARSGSCN